MTVNDLLSWRQWVLNVSRLYLRLTPIKRGKVRLLNTIRPLLQNQSPFQVKSRFDTLFQLSFPEDYGWEDLYILGTYETGTSKLVQQILRPGDVVFDVGANIGWYTVLCARLIHPSGFVHAFEPVPWIHDKLVANVSLNDMRKVVALNALALGAQTGTTELFTFEGRSHGETSEHQLAGVAVRSSSIADMTTLDDYLRSQSGIPVDLIKIDAEGAEEDVIRGASGLLSRPTDRPMLLMEINFETSRHWSPHELLAHLRANYGYSFLRVKQAWGEVVDVHALEECEHGDNVLCFDPSRHKDRLTARSL